MVQILTLMYSTSALHQRGLLLPKQVIPRNNPCKKMSIMSYIEEQLSNLDDYGYSMPPSSRRKLRKVVIRTSRSIVGKGIYLAMCIVGGLLWLGRLGKKYPPLTPATF